MINYTTGNWTVTSLYNDLTTVERTQNLPIISYAHDYAKGSEEATDASVKNVSAEGVTSPESIRFGSTPVKDIYAGTSVDNASRLPSKAGVQAMVEISETYRAVNTVSGGEYDIPCKVRLVVRVPSSQPVKTAIVTDLVKRILGTCYNAAGDDASEFTRITDLLKGALLPEGV